MLDQSTATEPASAPTEEVPEEPPGTGLTERVAGVVTRVVERIRNAPAATWLTLVAVAGSALFVFWQLSPSKVLSDTTAAGGDMGAHVWGPAYLRDHLLPDLQLAGWTQDWYAGFPAYQFYMVVPALFVVILDVVLPYNVAFKLITVAGVVAMPVAGWAFARLARLPFPMPALCALGTTFFLFDTNFSIYGGNLASTLAGEFAFSISLTFAILYAGLLVRGINDGTHRGWAAITLALCALCHIIPAIFAAALTVVAVLVKALEALPRWYRFGWLAVVVAAASAWALGVAYGWSDLRVTLARLALVGAAGGLLGSMLATRLGRRRIWWVTTAGASGLLMSIFWVGPFFLRRAYLNDMGWQKLTEFADNLFQPHETVDPSNGQVLIVWFVLAAVGTVWALWRWNTGAVVMALSGGVAAVAFVVMPQYRLWNARVLPFWYLAIYLLGAIGIGAAVRALPRVAALIPARAGPELGDDVDADAASTRSGLGWALLAGSALAVAVMFYAVALPMGDAPFSSRDGDSRYAIGPLSVNDSFISGWARWNYSGYEKKAAYPEYYDVVQMMERVGADNGCGRTMWEYEKELDRFGTPMALMLLPHWTDGCIGSMEGLFFEASATVPYHFLIQSEMSANPSRPMRDIPYRNLDIGQGVDHLQMMGVRYYLAFSDEAVAGAFAEPDLTQIASTGGWTLFEVAEAELVAPLANEPVVAEDMGAAGRDWADPSMEWFNDSGRWDVLLASDGPESWARVESDERPPARALEPVVVSDVVEGDDSISFRVDRVGVPVVVRTSYFPNWEVSGADGPYRVTPNLMVVVPTENEVRLSYGATWVEYTSWAATFAGLVLLWFIARRPVDLTPVEPKVSDEAQS